MTDSVKLCAFSDRSGATCSVPGIGTLQAKVGARAGETAHRALEVALPPAAHAARPARLGKKVEHVRTAEQPDHLPAPDHGHPPDPLADEKPRRLIDPGFLGDRYDARANDVARGLALPGEDGGLGCDSREDASFDTDRRRAPAPSGQGR